MVTVMLYHLAPELGYSNPDANHPPPLVLEWGEMAELCIALRALVAKTLKVSSDEVWVMTCDAGPWPPAHLAYWINVRMASSDFDRLQLGSTLSKSSQLAQAVAEQLQSIRGTKGVPPGEVHLELVEGSRCAILQPVPSAFPVSGLAL